MEFLSLGQCIEPSVAAVGTARDVCGKSNGLLDTDGPRLGPGGAPVLPLTRRLASKLTLDQCFSSPTGYFGWLNEARS